MQFIHKDFGSADHKKDNNKPSIGCATKVLVDILGMVDEASNNGGIWWGRFTTLLTSTASAWPWTMSQDGDPRASFRQLQRRCWMSRPARSRRLFTPAGAMQASRIGSHQTM